MQLISLENVLKKKLNDKTLLHYLLIISTSVIISLLLSKTIWTSHVKTTHTLIEITCIFIALSSFLVLFFVNDKSYSFNRFIGFGLLAIAVFDIFHTYYFLGLKLNPADFFDLSTRYWILGRLTEVVILLFAFSRLSRFKINRWLVLTLTLLFSLGTSLLILNFKSLMPVLLTQNGVTTPKIIAEYIIIFLSIVSLVNIGNRIHNPRQPAFRYIFMSVLLIIPAELVFTIYKNITSFYNALGHTLRIFSYFYLFRAIFVSTVTYPNQTIKRAKIKLRRSRNDLRDILNGLPLGIITYKNGSRVSFANNMACELLECSPNNILGITVDEMGKIFASDKQSLVHQLNTSLSEHICLVKEYRTLKGRKISLNVDIFKYKDGVFASFSDAEKDQELSDLKIQTSTILNSVSNLIIIFDKNFRIINLNKALLDCFEMDYNDIINGDLRELFNMLQFTENNSMQKPASNTLKNSSIIEASIVTPKGNKKHVFFHSNPILNLKKETIGYISVLTDITDIKTEHEKIQHQEKLAIIGQMGAGIVHETKNHLASIKGYCQLLSLSIKDPHLKKHIERIENISSDLNRVIVDFLSLAKPGETTMDVVSINEILESMRYMLESPSFMKGVKIDIEMKDFDRDIKADESQIKQVILNITKNAIEAMSDTDNPRLLLSTCLSDTEDEVLLSISDNGKGISKENLKKLGTPFFTTKVTGTGLGLSICYKIIQEHSGKIKVNSKEGEGTEFIISFPAIKDNFESQSEAC